MFQLFKQALVGVDIQHAQIINRNFVNLAERTFYSVVVAVVGIHHAHFKNHNCVNLAERTFSSVVVAVVEPARTKGPCSKLSLIAESNIEG